MVTMFFYDKFTNVELLKKINEHFEINDGFVLMQKYDRQKNILEISDKSINNNTKLNGKIVIFDMTLDDVIKKINEIYEYKIKKTKYTLETIWTTNIFDSVSQAYIIY
jgi:hypothetical protein